MKQIGVEIGAEALKHRAAERRLRLPGSAVQRVKRSYSKRESDTLYLTGMVSNLGERLNAGEVWRPRQHLRLVGYGYPKRPERQCGCRCRASF